MEQKINQWNFLLENYKCEPEMEHSSSMQKNEKSI